MLHVTLVNLARDATQARPDLGRCDLGALEPAELIGLLETFRTLDPVANHDARPSIVIATAHDQFVIRVQAGALLLFDPRQPSTPGTVIEPVALAEELTGGRLLARPRHRRVVRGNARPFAVLLLLVAGLALDFVVLRAALAPQPVDGPAAHAFVTDAAQHASLLSAAGGVYRTGDQPGDRLLRIRADGTVEFFQLTPSGERADAQDTLHVARDGRQIRLVTTASGVIDVTNIEVVVYYRDTYHRLR